MNATRFWTIVIGVIGTVVVIASILYWLNKETYEKRELIAELESTKKELAKERAKEPKVVEKEVIKEVVKEVFVEVPVVKEVIKEVVKEPEGQKSMKQEKLEPQTKKVATKEQEKGEKPLAKEPEKVAIVEPKKQIDSEAKQKKTINAPISIAKIECKNMRIGGWDMPKECEKEIAKLVKKIDGADYFIAITPVVDKRRFPDGQNELKQAGLAQFRIDTTTKIIRKYSKKDLLIFGKKPVHTQSKRGVIVELFKTE